MMSEESTDIKKYRLMLIVGIVVFSLLYGPMIYMDAPEELLQGVVYGTWSLFYGYCALLAAKYRAVSINGVLFLRLFASCFVCGLILWFNPWYALTELGSYVSSIQGIFVVSFIGFWVTAICTSALLYIVVACTLKSRTHLSLIIFIRYLLVTALTAFATVVLFIVFSSIMQLLPANMIEVVYYANSIASQLTLGISYYFVMSLFLKKDTPNKGDALKEGSNG